jgi:hypothetical protein
LVLYCTVHRVDDAAAEKGKSTDKGLVIYSSTSRHLHHTMGSSAPAYWQELKGKHYCLTLAIYTPTIEK